MAERVIPSLRHLRVFATVAEQQCIRRAADLVSLTQPAVTQAIAKIEAQVGTVLFERRSSGTFLNDAGRILFARTVLLFQQIEEALVGFGVPNSGGRTVEALAHRITHGQIRVLAAIATSRSFAGATSKGQVSAVSLHRTARELERILGKPMFRQSPSGTVATPAGVELARKMSLATREIGWAIEEIQAAEGRVLSELRVGAMPLAGSLLLGSVINDITKLYPRAHVHVRTGHRADLTEALRIGDIDFIVGMNGSLLNPEELASEPLIASPFVLVGRVGHPLSGKASLSVADLVSHDWVVPTAGATRRVVFDALFASMPNPPDPTVEANALSTTRLLISGSDRLTLLTRFEFEYERNAGTIVMLPFPPIRPIHSIDVAWRAKWTPTSLHRKFLDLIRARALAFERAMADQGEDCLRQLVQEPALA